MFRVNGMQIMMTAGDTGLLAVIPDEEGYVPTAEDRAVFTVREKPGREKPGRRAVMEKTIVPEADGRVKIEFASADTARLSPGSYVWDIRFALEAEVDAKGKVMACREVIKPCAPGRMDIVDALKGG